jgi:tyrosyl-tRNA synthetase
VVNYLKYFSLLSRVEIEEMAASLTSAPEKREAPRKLAQAVTRLVHGEAALKKAEQASKILFGGEIGDLGLQDLLDVFADVPSASLSKNLLSAEGCNIADIIVASGLVPSKGEAKRLIQGGGIYLNNQRVQDNQRSVTLNDAIEGQAFVLRKGAKEYRLVKLSQS